MCCLALTRGMTKPRTFPAPSTSRSEGQAAMPSSSGLAARVMTLSLRTLVGPGGVVYTLAAWSGRPCTAKIVPSPPLPSCCPRRSVAPDCRSVGSISPAAPGPAGRQDQGDVVVGSRANPVGGEELLQGYGESSKLPQPGRPVQRLEHPAEEGFVDGF